MALQRALFGHGFLLHICPDGHLPSVFPHGGCSAGGLGSVALTHVYLMVSHTGPHGYFTPEHFWSFKQPPHWSTGVGLAVGNCRMVGGTEVVRDMVIEEGMRVM